MYVNEKMMQWMKLYYEKARRTKALFDDSGEIYTRVMKQHLVLPVAH
jgi:hypothetical protein